jgi:hypothetical protein
MNNRTPRLELTWAGFDAAVDLIAAQCRWRDRPGVHAASADGEPLAAALSTRLGLSLLELAGPGMLLVDATPTEALQEKASSWGDVEAWVWVDTSSRGRWPSVMKACGPAVLLFPWRRQFLPGFDD